MFEERQVRVNSIIYGSVNSKRANPPGAFFGHLSSCRSRRWGFVAEPLVPGGALLF